MSKEAFKALLEEYIELKEANKRLSDQITSLQKVIQQSVDMTKPKIDLYEVNKYHSANLVIGGGITPMWGLQPNTVKGISKDDSHNWG